MTLLRQVMIAVIGIFLFLFTANFLLTVYGSRAYLEQQMSAHAQDTATSLGLSITTALAEREAADLELLVGAVFDRGYYQEITLIDLDNKTLIERKNTIHIDDVPTGFIRLVELSSPAGYAEIMSGWSMLGTLKVVAHPGHAYRDLWRITVDFFYLFFATILLSYGLLGVILNVVMRPLKQVEQQADDICDRKYPILEEVPRTRELRRVVEAMNRMSVKLKVTFQRQLKLTESLRIEAKTDPVTGLINRREFDALVSGILSSESGPGSSVLMLLQVRNFSEVNSSLGRNEADVLLGQIAERLTHALASSPEVTIGRRSGADFGIYIPRINLERARVFLQTTFQAVASLKFFTQESNLNRIHMGAAFHEVQTEPSMMLTTADTALRTAQNESTNNTNFLIHGDSANPISDLVKQAGEWKKTLDSVILNENLLFHYQPIYQLPGRDLLANEIYVRIELNDKIVNAGVFMPMAERFGLLVQLDRLIIARALDQLGMESPHFMINLSTQSILDEDFLTWLINILRDHQDLSSKIVFEFQEYSVHLAYEHIKQLTEFATPLGFRFSIDHFGSGSTAFSYLQSLDIHFIKIDRSFVAGISDNVDNQFFIQSVAQIAHTRDMKLIAEGVESDSELQTLSELGVDAVMGFLLGRPGPDY